VPPFLSAGLRFLLASGVLFALAASRRARFKLTKDDKIAVLSCGLLSFTLSYALVYWAEQYITSGLTAVLWGTMPLVTAILSRFWTRTETLNARKMAGICLGMAGTALLFWPREGVTWTELGGMTAALASSTAAAVNLVMMKKHSKHTDIFVLNALGMSMGAVLLLSLSFATESYTAVAWSRANVLAIVYLALVGSVTAFLSYYHLVKLLDATSLSMITLIFPLVAVALGCAWGHESVSALMTAGIGTVVVGVATAVLPSRKKPADIPPP
jgi:drug/metabolite transporter (DMT)-like permease